MKKIGVYTICLISSILLSIYLCSMAFCIETKDRISPGEVFIKAVNPGYTIDGESNVGEMIEIGRKSNGRVLLAGLTIGYTNSKGNYSVLFEFPENSYLAGETILLRLKGTLDDEKAAENYTKTLAFKGGIELRMNDLVIDSLCWTGEEGCYEEFKTAEMMTLVKNLETNEFEKIKNYEPEYNESSYLIEIVETEKMPQCNGVIFSEILSYYETSKAEQFIELYNSTSEQILLNGCNIRYKNKLYELNGVIKPEEYFLYYPTEFSLVKNPTNSSTLEIIDINGEVDDRLDYPNGQRKGTSYMMVGYDEAGDEIWRTTYVVTPGTVNNYQEFKTCEEGKVINEETGNCVKVTNVTETICEDGQYLNPLTGRCKKYETQKETVCEEGYYYNEGTGRCRKIVENDGAEYELKPESYEEKSNFIGVCAVISVVILGILYVIYEFRHEIGDFLKRIFHREK